MMRRIVVFLVFVLVVLLCGGLIGFNFVRERAIADFFSKMQPPPQVVAAADVTAKLWTPGIDAIGTARAENGVELAVETGGVVKDINIKPNQRFAKGDVLVQLDDSVERADLLDIQAAVKLSQANLERSTALRSRGFDTQASYDQLEAQLATARSRMAKVQAVIDQKALKAPFSGVAGIARINPGQYLTPGTVVTTFQDLRSMKVDFTVPEQLASQVKVGQPVRFGLTENDLPYTGRVAGLDPRVDPQTRLVAVQAILTENKNETILPGQFMHVRIDLPPQPNVITVPQTAVISSLYGDYVYTVEREDRNGQAWDVARQIFVKVGRRRGAESEILSGLQPGQKVVVSGQNKLQAGSTVKIDNSIDVTKVATGE
jgi:membrane fusion protein (multidrug efflux system)